MSNKALTGGCACGAIRYKLAEKPLIVHACHCRDCQRITGSAFVINLWIEKKFVEPGAAQPNSFKLKGGSGHTHEVFFCGTCGVYVWSRYHGAPGDALFVRAGTLDNPDAALELMARRELARFAVGRTGIARGHSIDRREVSQLFAMGESADARAFFGGFDRIDSFFAAADARFRRSLESVVRGEVHFYPFRPPGDGHVAEYYLHAIGEPSGAPVESRLDVLPDDSAAAASIL